MSNFFWLILQGRFATGPSDFDPSGLRATMSVTWDETEKSLDTYMPDHVSGKCLLAELSILGLD